MKVTEEKCARLCALTGLGADQILGALEHTQGDELRALLHLKELGLIADSGVKTYSTAEHSAASAHASKLLVRAGERGLQSVKSLRWWERVWLFLVGNRLVAERRENRRIECPLGALLALLVIAWHVVAAVLVLGWVLGWRYRFEGPDLGEERLKKLLYEWGIPLGRSRKERGRRRRKR